MELNLNILTFNTTNTKNVKKDNIDYQYIEDIKQQTREHNRNYFLVAYKKNSDGYLSGKYLNYKIYNQSISLIKYYSYCLDLDKRNEEEQQEKETLRRCLNRVKVFRKHPTKSDDVIILTQPFHIRIVTPLTRQYRSPNLPEDWWLSKENFYIEKSKKDQKYKRERGYRIQIYSVINARNVRTVYWIEKGIKDNEWRRIIMSYHLSEIVPFQYDEYDELCFEGEDD